jgi:uncharacterized protein YprB with RNaseH-like and TPR domain
MDIGTLKDRLRGIVKPASETALDRTGSDVVSGFSRTEPEIASGSPTPEASARLAQGGLGRTLSGSWRETPSGRSFVISQRFAPGDLHGRHRVVEFAETLEESSPAAALVGRSLAASPFVFFDLETTGLNGGAGTHAFLVGCGWFDEQGGFVTEQHLMTDFADERSMLGVVADDLRRAGTLMSFNGKSFDAPMLETRYLFHRLESPCANRPHVDLVHPARRFWGGDGEGGCSLGALEAQLLAVGRSGDVAGFEIPARYFRFVRTGDASSLVEVLHHNRLDLLSLAGLTARIFHLVQAGPGAATNAREALALGRVYREAGLDERAEDAFQRTLTLLEHETAGNRTNDFWFAARRRERLALKVDAVRALALLARRQRRYEAAAARWQQLVELAECPAHISREAIEALAIYHEHRARDLAAAKMFALRGVELEAAPARGDAARHRLARIERKLVNDRPTLFPSSTLPLSSGSPTSEPRTSS